MVEFGWKDMNKAACLTHQKMYYKNQLIIINGGLEKAFFSKNASLGRKFQIIKKTTYLVLLFEICYNLQPQGAPIYFG